MCKERFERIEEDRKIMPGIYVGGDVLQIAGTTVEATCLALDARVRIYPDCTGYARDRHGTDARQTLLILHSMRSGPGENGSGVGK